MSDQALEGSPGERAAERPRASGAPERVRGLRSRGPELWVAVGLTVVILCFHLLRMANAGGLWRDEAATAHLAANFSVSDLIRNSQYEIFPLLLPALVHGYGWLAGDSDTALRVFGLLVGIAIVAALWWNLWALRRGPPLISLALLGFNATVLQWGDALRGYGIGTLFILLTAGLIWRLVEQPTPWRIATAALCAVASVQCVFTNSVLLLAICLGAVAVTIRRGVERRAALVLAIGLVAALSLLPYWKPLHEVREWDMLVRWPVTVESLCFKLGEALSASGWWNCVIWVLLFLAGLLACLVGQSRRTLHLARELRDFLFFSGTVLVIAVAGYFGFLKTASVPTQPWYYLALMALVALFLDFVFDTLRQHRWARMARLTVVIITAGASVWLTWREGRVRQTNVDLVAARLDRLAGAKDLIVITPWYNGISFDRYYRGPATWMTIPPIEFHKFHRYDLVKARMVMADQNEAVKPVLDKISETLKSGHRVWVAGPAEFLKPNQPIPDLSPAPDAQLGWHDVPYTLAWSVKTVAYLQVSARRKEQIPIRVAGRVNPYEELSVIGFDGWWGL